VTLPQELLDELRRNPARERFFRSFFGPRAALLVVDMQNHWVDPRGQGYVAAGQGIVKNINSIARIIRSNGGGVAWIRSSFSPEGRSAWPMLFEALEPPELSPGIRAALSPGNPMHELWPGLAVEAGDLEVRKDRFSALAEGASDLERQLRARGVDTVIVTGVVTNVCCESTARDAMMRDFRTVMVSDATAARTDEDHLAGLTTFAKAFGAVMTAAEVVARIADTPDEAPSYRG
jgi:nicotinamidase-related amidase